MEIDQDMLNALSIPILSVIDQLGMNNLNLLAGEVEGERDKYMLRTMGEFKSVDEIRNIPISSSPSGSLMRLKDIAKVEDSFLDAENYARLGMAPERIPSDIVSLYVHKESAANTIKAVEGVKRQIDGPIREKLAQLGLVLGEDLNIEIISDQAAKHDLSIAVENVPVSSHRLSHCILSSIQFLVWALSSMWAMRLSCATGSVIFLGLSRTSWRIFISLITGSVRTIIFRWEQGR